MAQLHIRRRRRIEKLRENIVDLYDDRNEPIINILDSIRKPSFDVFPKDGPYAGLTILDFNDTHKDNDDEDDAASPFAGNFSKGLRHDNNGFVVPDDYRQFRRAMIELANGRNFPDSDALAKIDRIPRAPGDPRPFVNPIAGICADIQGLDPFDISIPPAPKLASARAAAEMVELYWMALLRDEQFATWLTPGGSGNDLARAGVQELNLLNAGSRFTEHYDRNSGKRGWSDQITLQRLFRGSARGNDEGGYISQFLLLNVPYGTIDFEQKQRLLRLKDPSALKPRRGKDYMTSWADWLNIQNGNKMPDQRPNVEDTPIMEGDRLCDVKRRHVVTLRDLAHYVHYDALHEAYFNAALILGGYGFRLAPGNPYFGGAPDLDNPYGFPDRTGTQQGFGTLGGPYILGLLTEVATRALKTVWHQKWYVHRRLRPEAMGGRIHLALLNPAQYGALVNVASLTSDPNGALARIRNRNRAENPNEEETALLPMAFPEGSPMHPSYGAGHATVAGACVTILKALFDTTQTFTQEMGGDTINRAKKVMLSDDETVSWLVDDPASANLTVGGELNKLAANIAIGRNAAGVHYRTDYTKSLALGEAVAVAVLQEQALAFKEAGVRWEFESFSGDFIRVSNDGSIERFEDVPAEEGYGMREGVRGRHRPSLKVRLRNLFST